MASALTLLSHLPAQWPPANGDSPASPQLLQQMQLGDGMDVVEVKFTQPPTLSIVQQPAQHYRFRYQSEVEGGKIGGLLLGRDSDEEKVKVKGGGKKNSSSYKSYVKVQVSGIDPAQHSHLQLIACTASSDKSAHPFYLHGDSCHDGYFEVNKEIDERSFRTSTDFTVKNETGGISGVWDVKLDKLAVICVPKKNQNDMRKALETRAARVPLLHDMTAASDKSSSSSSFLNRVRLAFSLTYTDHQGFSQTLPTVFTDEILDEKDKKKTEVSIECLNPEEVPFGEASEVAIYTSTPTTGLQKNDLKVLLTFVRDGASDEETTIELDVVELKKVNHLFSAAFGREGFTQRQHLLVFKTPRLNNAADRLKCSVTVRYNQFHSRESHTILFAKDLQPSYRKLTGSAVKRPALD